MRQICPVLRPEQGSSCSRSEAFTLLEVLIALVIVALLTFTVGGALVSVLGAERRTSALQECAPVLHRITSAHYRGADLSSWVPRALPGWRIDAVQGTASEETDPEAWNTWAISPAGSTLNVQISFRKRIAPIT